MECDYCEIYEWYVKYRKEFDANLCDDCYYNAKSNEEEE